MSKKILLVEAFGPTIQGEGSVIGYQTIFLRFGGCDYRCERCDSLHAVLPQLFSSNVEYLTMEELIQKTWDTVGHCEWITLSGGNPCMWNLTDLIVDLGGFDKKGIPGVEDKYKKFALETQGTLWQDWIPLCTKVTVSPKGPGMGEQFEPRKFDRFVQELWPAAGERHPGFSVKVVIFDQRDIEFAVEILDRWPQLKPVMFFSIGNIYPPKPAKQGPRQEPAYTFDDEDVEVSKQELTDAVLGSYLVIAEEVMADPRLSSVRILPQLHTLLWGNAKGK